MKGIGGGLFGNIEGIGLDCFADVDTLTKVAGKIEADSVEWSKGEEFGGITGGEVMTGIIIDDTDAGMGIDDGGNTADKLAGDGMGGGDTAEAFGCTVNGIAASGGDILGTGVAIVVFFTLLSDSIAIV
jgi:hypothetical protein